MTHFALSDAYQLLCNEFNQLQWTTNNYDQLSKINDHERHGLSRFIQQPLTEGISRTLSVRFNYDTMKMFSQHK